MPFVIPSDIPTPLVPLSWLLGRWQGQGVVEYPTMECPINFTQQVQFSHDGRRFLYYSSRTKLLDDDGAVTGLAASEMGFWRVVEVEDPFEDAKSAPGVPIELLLTHPTGIAEIYVGRATGARIDLESDVIALSQSAKEYRAAKRMYGNVDGELMWVMDMEAVGHEMVSHVSARLSRVEDFTGSDE